MKHPCPKIFLPLLLMLATMFFLRVHQIKAAESISLTASPVRVGDDNSLTLNPGDKKQIQLKVRNNSAEAIKIESAAVDFTVADDGQTPLAVSETTSNRWSLASWLTIVPAINEVPAGEAAVINVLIEVPADALPGGHYAMIYHTPENASKETVSASGISQRVGTLLYVIVNGDIKQAASISHFEWPKFKENGPVDFSVTVNNQSDVHLALAPQIKIYNLFGKQVGEVTAEKKNVFPLSERAFAGTWQKIWGFGYYKAVAEVIYGDQGQVATAVASMWMIPVKLILLVLIAVLLAVILLIALQKKKRKDPPQDKGNFDESQRITDVSEEKQVTQR